MRQKESLNFLTRFYSHVITTRARLSYFEKILITEPAVQKYLLHKNEVFHERFLQ